MKRTKNGEYICLGIMGLITLAIVFAVNYKMGYYNDDLWYSTNLVSGESLKSIKDIWESQVWHYKNWGGRSMAHGLLQLSFLAGPYAINFINLFATCLLAVLLTANSGKYSFTEGFWTCLLAFSLFVSCNANQTDTLLWQSGVANYLYMGIFQVIYIGLFLRALDSDKKQNCWWLSVLMLPSALIAGWSNENMGPALWIGSLMVIIYLLKKCRKLPWFLAAGNLLCLFGSAMMILAPGNFIRSKEAEEALYDSRLHRQIIYRLYWVSKGIFTYLFPILIVALILLLIYCAILKQKLAYRDIVLFAVGILATFAMLLSPHFPDRATFGILIIFIAGSLDLIRQIVRLRPESMRYFKIGTVFFWLAAMYFFCEKFLYAVSVLRF